MKKDGLYVIIICIVAIAVFWGTLSLYFVADDFVFVKSARDLSFSDLLNAEKTLNYQGFPVFLYERFIPLFVLFKLDYALWGQNAIGYHLTNLILHVLCCIGVYLLAFTLTKHQEISFVSGLFFAAHYAHVGGIAFVANRQAPTTCVFYILSVISYILYVQKHRQKRYYAAALLGYICAVLSYEIGLTLPLLFLMYELLFVRERFLKALKDCIIRYIPFALIGCGYVVLYLSIQISKQKVTFSIHKLLYPIRYTLDLLFPFASAQFSFYVALRSFLKSQLHEVSYGIIGFLLIVLLLVVIGIGYLFIKSSVIMKFLLCWIYVSLLLAFIAPYYAESLIYIPSVGFCIGLACWLFKLFKRNWFFGKSYQRLLKIGVLGIILVMYSLVTYTRIPWWAVGGTRTRQILSGIQETLPVVPSNSCVFLADPPEHYNFVVPTFLSDEDLTSALQLAYDDSTILADRLFLRKGKSLKTQRIDFSFGSRDCEPDRTYVFKYTDKGGVLKIDN